MVACQKRRRNAQCIEFESTYMTGKIDLRSVLPYDSSSQRRFRSSTGIEKAAVGSTYWQSRAKHYEEYSSWCRDLGLFAKCTEPLKSLGEASRCLDLGGGTGWVARHDNELTGRQWTVLDQCADYGKYIRPPITFVVGDAHRTRFPNSSFDFILARSLLHYVDCPRVLAEARRLLCSKGTLVVAQKILAYRGSESEWFSELDRLKRPEPTKAWSAKQLLIAITSAGYILHKVSFLTMPRKIMVREWFESGGKLSNPNQHRINKLFRTAPKSVRNYLKLNFTDDEISYLEQWMVVACQPLTSEAVYKATKSRLPRGRTHGVLHGLQL